MRYPLQPLLDAAGLSLAQLNARIRMGGDTYRRIQSEGLSELVADRWAVRLGLHPAEVWDSWMDAALEDASRACAARGCAETFIPYRRNQVYCSRRCGNRERTREHLAKRRQDPAFREAERLRRRANYAESRDYELRRARLLWRTDPEFRRMKEEARRRWREANPGRERRSAA